MKQTWHACCFGAAILGRAPRLAIGMLRAHPHLASWRVCLVYAHMGRTSRLMPNGCLQYECDACGMTKVTLKNALRRLSRIRERRAHGANAAATRDSRP